MNCANVQSTEGSRCRGLATQVVVLIGILVFSSLHCALAANEEGGSEDKEWTLRQGVDDVTQEYLSDRRRTGALIGGVLGGALMAHPVGSVVGSVAGFFIGKTTRHQDPTDDAAAQWQEARRFAPLAADADVPVLSFSQPADEPTRFTSRSNEETDLIEAKDQSAEQKAPIAMARVETRQVFYRSEESKKNDVTVRPRVEFGLSPPARFLVQPQGLEEPANVTKVLRQGDNVPKSVGQVAADSGNTERFGISWVHPEDRSSSD